MKKFKLDSMRFEEIFAGPVPQFEFSEIKVKKAAVKKPESRDVSPGPSKKSKDCKFYSQILGWFLMLIDMY